MIRRLAAIAFIFLCTTAAWMFLGATIQARTGNTDPGLQDKVASSWGSAQVQAQPTVDGPLAVESSNIDADLHLEYRQKGLLWYSTYTVNFAGTYEIRNDTDHDLELLVHWALPAQKAIYDNVSISRMDPLLHAGKTALFRVAYRSRGLDTWTYNLSGEAAQVRNFKLNLTTNFEDVDFPENALSPSSKNWTEKGWRLSWNYTNLVSGYQIAVTMPARLQPGPLAGEISYFAPVSLFFFFFVMLMISTLRGIDLHPVNYFFLAAAFFAFHLLLAYLVDHISIHAAFLISSIVSTALMVSYLRLVTGIRFALREAGLAQFVFLVLFSYAFFFKGFTGLSITIGAILTLFVSMQLTGRVRWSEQLEFNRALSNNAPRA